MCQQTRRDYWRCNHCLSIIATEGAKEPKLDCDLCSHPMEWMGQVRQEDLIVEETKCACDDRCTSARGPICNCKCGGVNHGTYAVVQVIKVVGKVPRVAPIDIEQSKANIKETEEILKKINEMFIQFPDHEKFESRAWISNRNAWWGCFTLNKLRKKLPELKTMSSRRKILDKANTQFPILMLQVKGA